MAQVPLELCHGRARAVLVEQYQRPVEVGRVVGRVNLLGPVQPGHGLVDETTFSVYPALVRQGFGLVGLSGEHLVVDRQGRRRVSGGERRGLLERGTGAVLSPRDGVARQPGRGRAVHQPQSAGQEN